MTRNRIVFLSENSAEVFTVGLVFGIETVSFLEFSDCPKIRHKKVCVIFHGLPAIVARKTKLAVFPLRDALARVCARGRVKEKKNIF